MIGFDKLASNARRFKMLMGMSLQEFDLLLTKMEKAYPGEERKRLSKRSRQREIGAGRRFALGVRDRTLLLSHRHSNPITPVAINWHIASFHTARCYGFPEFCEW